jgi:hypothetical protein
MAKSRCGVGTVRMVEVWFFLVVAVVLGVAAFVALPPSDDPGPLFAPMGVAFDGRMADRQGTYPVTIELR